MNSLSKTVIGQRRNCDLNPGPSAPESSTLTTQLPSELERCDALATELDSGSRIAEFQCERPHWNVLRTSRAPAVLVSLQPINTKYGRDADARDQ